MICAGRCAECGKAPYRHREGEKDRAKYIRREGDGAGDNRGGGEDLKVVREDVVRKFVHNLKDDGEFDCMV